MTGMKPKDKTFCCKYLKTMAQEIASEKRGQRSGFSVSARKDIRTALGKMGTDAAMQICREDVRYRLEQVAFGQANDAMTLVLSPHTAKPKKIDLSAGPELKITEKNLEIKLIDRVRAWETLWNILESDENSYMVEPSYQNLLLFESLHPDVSRPYGRSLLYSLPLLTDILMKLHHITGDSRECCGNVRFTKSPEDGGAAEVRRWTIRL